MKKKTTYVLVVALLVSCFLCGCSSKTPDDTPTSQSAYTANYINISASEPVSSPDVVNPLYFADGGFYGSVSIVVGEYEHAGVELRWEGEFDIKIDMPCFVSYADGTLTMLENYTAPLVQDGHQIQNALLCMTAYEDGLLVIESVFEYWWDIPQNEATYHYFASTYIRHIDSSGTILSSVPIEVDVDTFNPQVMRVNENGNIEIASWDRLWIIDMNGAILEQREEEYTDNSVGLLNWSQYGIDANAVQGMATLEGGEIVCVYLDETSPNFVSSKLLVLRKGGQLEPSESDAIKNDMKGSRVDPATGKIILTLASDNVSSIGEEVTRFNNSDAEYCIEIIDYSELGYDRFLMQVMTGNMPDILDLGFLPTRQLAEKGLLEDLYPFIDSDPELNREDFMKCILDTCTYDGKLACTISNFDYVVVVGPAELLGSTPGISFNEFNAIVQSMPEGMSAVHPYMTRENTLSNSLAIDLDSYIDWDTFSCHFDSPEFIQYLNFIASLADEASVDFANVDFTGPFLLSTASIYSFDQYPGIARTVGTDNFTFIGYPCAAGIGNAIHVRGDFAMSSSCEYKDAAWQFMRSYMTEDYQNTQMSFPSNRNLCNWRSQGAVNSGVITQAQGDKVWELITTTTKTDTQNTAIYQMILEQVQPFFAGDKTAEEVAQQIQSRVGLFLAEMQ